jgi:DNA repair protein SbcD/Mre11
VLVLSMISTSSACRDATATEADQVAAVAKGGAVPVRLAQEALLPGPRRIKLLHTSDVHIGDEVYPALRLHGLAAAVDAAIEHRVDALLIAGDLFDSARVKEPDITAAWQHLARAPMPVILIPGNHDCMGKPSIYSRTSHTDAGAHVHFLCDPDGEHLTLHDLGLTVWARGMVEHEPANFPLRGHQGLPDGNWQVVMAHGHYIPSGEETYRSSPIPEEQIAALECDYLALGHWHRFQDVTANGVPAFYCGSPAEPGIDAGTANLVTLDPAAGVSVERMRLVAYEGLAR